MGIYARRALGPSRKNRDDLDDGFDRSNHEFDVRSSRRALMSDRVRIDHSCPSWVTRLTLGLTDSARAVESLPRRPVRLGFRRGLDKKRRIGQTAANRRRVTSSRHGGAT